MTHPEQPNEFGSMPAAPRYVAQPEAVEPAVERPATVTRAVQLMYAGAALSVVGIVAAWATKSQLHDQIADSGTDLSADAIDTAVTVALGFATVVGLVGVGLWIWMAVANNAGKSWARVLGTVFGGLNVVFTLYGLTSSTGPAVALSLLSVVLAVVIIVLLWRPASTAFYQSRSARRA